jgi:hypothetical protein
VGRDFPHTFKSRPGNSCDSAGFWALQFAETEPKTTRLGIGGRPCVRLSLLPNSAVRFGSRGDYTSKTVADPHVIRERAKSRFPSVLLTLLSIIQALALEVLWSNLSGSDHLWAGGLGAAVGWLQVSAVFGGIVVVWLFYSSLVMRLVWVPSIRDSILPFIIGGAEFLMAEMLSPELRHLWFFLFAGIFGLSAWTSSTTFAMAKRDPDNAGLWDDFDPYSTGALVGPIGVVGLLAAAGVGVWIWGATGLVALVAVGFANFALILQILAIRYFWNRSLGLNQ